MASLFKTNSKFYEEDDYHLDLVLLIFLNYLVSCFCIINDVGVG